LGQPFHDRLRGGAELPRHSAGLRPACASSSIFWRNSARYGGLDLGMVDSLFLKDWVSTEMGQLQGGGATLTIKWS
jgi:hypothetical protein